MIYQLRYSSPVSINEDYRILRTLKSAVLCFIAASILVAPVCLTANFNNNFHDLNSTLHNRIAFAADISLNDIELHLVDLASQEAVKGNWETVYTIVKDLNIQTAKPLLVRSLYEQGRYEELIIYVDNLSKTGRVRIFEKIIEYYLLSSLSIQKYGELLDIIELQRRFYPDITEYIYKQTLYTLLDRGEYGQIIELTDIFPADIYLDGEKNYMLGIAHYYLGFYNLSKGFFDNITDESFFKKLSLNYLSAIYYKMDILPESLSITSSGAVWDGTVMNNEVMFNTALNMLNTGMIDRANSLALRINAPEFRNLLDLFIAWEMGHYRTVVALLDATDNFSPSENSLSSLIMAESYYHTAKYREAELIFKLYRTFDDADIQYANHSLGYCFKGFYRFNNTAYYWIQNLTDHKSPYDSLAAYNLSFLYNQTQNYSSARYYFRYYIAGYGMPTEDAAFIEAYLETLDKQAAYVVFRDVFDKYGAVLASDIRYEALLKIGNHLNQKGATEQALDYFWQALETSYNDELLLMIERIKFSLGKYKDSEDFILSLIEKYPESSFNKGLSLDLTKFYLNQRKYEEAEEFLDSLLISYQLSDSLEVSYANGYVDSLRFFKGVTLKESGRLAEAADYFIKLNRDLTSGEREGQYYSPNKLKTPIIQRLNTLFSRMDGIAAVTYLNEVAENEKDPELRDEYLLLLANVYEKQSLYAQANRIYLLILDYAPANIEFDPAEEHPDTLIAEADDPVFQEGEEYDVVDSDTQTAHPGQDEEISELPFQEFNKDIFYRLAINEIRQMQYSKALEYINIIEEHLEEPDEEILFLSHLAHYSLDRRDKAIAILIDLYYDYPQSPKRFEFTKNLIDQLIEDNRFLYAWFFIKDYYPKASQAERWSLDRYMETLAPVVAEDSLAVEEILFPLIDIGLTFREVLADSLFFKKDGEWYSPLTDNE